MSTMSTAERPAMAHGAQRTRMPAERDDRIEGLVERALSDMVLRARSPEGASAALESALAALGPVLGLQAVAVRAPGLPETRWGGAPELGEGSVLPLAGRTLITISMRPGQPSTCAQLKGVGRLAEVTGELLKGLEVQKHQLDAERRRERARLAERVHDHAAQMLFAAEMELALADVGDRVERARDLVARARGALRSLLDEVESVDVDLLRDLDATVAELREDFGGDVDVRCGPGVVERARELGPDEEATIVRLVRETALNALKHGFVDRVSVAVRLAGEDRLVVVVTDEGLGLRPSASPSYGLRSLQRAITERGGSLRVRSRLHGGTRVVATMPL